MTSVRSWLFSAALVVASGFPWTLAQAGSGLPVAEGLKVTMSIRSDSRTTASLIRTSGKSPSPMFRVPMRSCRDWKRPWSA